MIRYRKTKIGLVILAFIAVVAVGGYGYVYSQLSKMKHVDIPSTDAELSISKDTGNANSKTKEDANPNIINIALFAVDTTNDNEPYNSDTIIILSIDKVHNKIKLSSILRDTYANVEGLGMTKINYAYARGGPTLALKTLNSNFNMNIKDYVTVNYDGYKNIIDTIGGVEVTVKDYEIPAMVTVGINSPGTYNLNGVQALEYCRSRHIGNEDYERTERQRAVLAKVIEKIKAGGITKYPSLVSALLPYTETSLTPSEIINLGTSIFMANINTIEQSRFPEDGYSKGEMIGDLYYEVGDLTVISERIHKFIYEQ
jgi:LCP family protein required for cell wall assembly